MYLFNTGKRGGDSAFQIRDIRPGGCDLYKCAE
jgi:hypothetical protein